MKLALILMCVISNVMIINNNNDNNNKGTISLVTSLCWSASRDLFQNTVKYKEVYLFKTVLVQHD